MVSKKVTDSLKNALGTVFLLAGAFFMCSIFLSVRSVFADPVAPMIPDAYGVQQNGRMNTNARNSGRTSPRAKANATRRTVARTTVVPDVVAERAGVPARSVPQSRAQSRSVASRTVVNRANVVQPKAVVSTRNVVSRRTDATNRANANIRRTIRARTATSDAADAARISLQGSAIRGSKASTSKSYSYLSNKLYTGNYSNIIDSTTGLISAEAFNNCMESYYTCMDEICTARNAAQRRCACAGRVKVFAEAEAALEAANEELIKVSGELALLVASGGKDVSEAFKLTDAEKVMNCVSWQEMSKKYTVKKDENGDGIDDATYWCQSHGFYDSGTCSATTSPKYCSTTNGGNDFGFNVSDLDGTGSDILAQLQSWAEAKKQTITILTDDEDNLFDAFTGVSDVVGGLAGISGSIANSAELKDSLAETWGYELFEYAHNNVCARVLDSCFNGIYEACGTPPSGVKCGNGAGQCPYNYNSSISVDKNGDSYNLNFITPSGSYTTSNSATCFGYTTSNGDPYADLRKPVADARRSIMQKYALDANADCDAYGEQLRTTAQNIGYQKVAAQQALQQQRLEFANAEAETVLTRAQTAMTNFNECLSEIYECYEETADSEENWPTSRIKTYCSQVANIPHCYEEMICTPTGAQFTAVIDVADEEKCSNKQDYETNTCRNIVTLNEILNGAYVGSLEGVNIEWGPVATANSAQMREHCLRNAMGIPLDGNSDGTWNIRNWKKDISDND